MLKVSQKLGYIPHSGLTAKTGNIGYLIPNITNSPFITHSFYRRFFEGVSQELKDKGCDLFVFFLKGDEILPSTLKKRKIDALIVEQQISGKLAEQANSILPIVFLNFNIDGVNIDSVMPDNSSGIRKAVFHLHELGHRKIAFWGMKPFTIHNSERLSGYFNALRSLHLSKREDFIKLPERKRGDSQEVKKLAQETLEGWTNLASPPTAVVTTGDIYALAFLQAAKQFDISIPRDLSIIGFDNIEACLYSTPHLTSINQPMEEMGKTACQLLFERMETPDATAKRITLGVELIIRESTGIVK